MHLVGDVVVMHKGGLEGLVRRLTAGADESTV